MIIIPKFPESNQLTLVKAKSEYIFSDLYGSEDFKHTIEVDYENRRIFTYNANNESKIIHSKLRGYQKAVNNVWNEEVKRSAKNLITMPSNVSDNGVISNLKKDFENKLRELQKSFENYRPDDIEKIVKDIFVSQGYIWEKSNHHNHGKGGDVDLILRKELPILCEINDEVSYDKIYIQVKKRIGKTDYNWEEGMKQLNEIVKYDFKDISMNNINIYKILVSTGTFDFDAENKAKSENIILINGLQLARLAIKFL